jgi:hypothetical protein
MSADVLQQIIDDIQSLSETDQKLLVQFLSSVKERRKTRPVNTLSSRNSALVQNGKLLIFTGKIANPEIDWLQREREDREQKLASFGS